MRGRRGEKGLERRTIKGSRRRDVSEGAPLADRPRPVRESCHTTKSAYNYTLQLSRGTNVGRDVWVLSPPPLPLSPTPSYKGGEYSVTKSLLWYDEGFAYPCGSVFIIVSWYLLLFTSAVLGWTIKHSCKIDSVVCK